MKVAAFIGSILLTTVLTVGVGTALALTAPERAADLVWLPAVALTALLVAPLVLGSVLATWDLARSAESRRYFRRYRGVLLALQALGAGLCGLYALLAGASPWLPVAFVAGGLLLDLAAVRIGTALRRRDGVRPVDPDSWRPIGRLEVQRRVLVVVTAFAVTFVVVGGAAGIVRALAGGDSSSADPLLVGVQFGLFAASIACIVVQMRVQRAVRETISVDVGLLRRLAQTVLRGRPAGLDPQEQGLAARYAEIQSVALPFSLAGTGTLYVALALQQVERLSEGRPDAFPLVMLGILVVLLAAFVPLQVRRIRRARAYAEEHRQLL